jgi:cold-inducible RNA-binding protein
VKKIFVGNLDFKATEESIRSLFEQHGTVERVSLMTDRDTGRSRGFAFVEMTDSAEAERAIAALNGFNFGGRALNVNEARPKVEGGGHGGGGGGFSSGRRRRRWRRWRSPPAPRASLVSGGAAAKAAVLTSVPTRRAKEELYGHEIAYDI